MIFMEAIGTFRPTAAALVALLPNGLYHVYELAAGKSFEFSVKGWKGLHTVMWSPDSKTILSAVSTPDGGTALIEVDLHGNARPVLVSANNIPLVWSIPSPDGRSLAIMAPIGENNVFLIENF